MGRNVLYVVVLVGVMLGNAGCSGDVTVTASAAPVIPMPVITTQLSSEYAAAVEYLKRADIPSLPEGWISAIIVKRAANSDCISFACVTSSGELKTVNATQGYLSAYSDAMFDVGDHIVFKAGDGSGTLLLWFDYEHCQIVKKLAFVPKAQ